MKRVLALCGLVIIGTFAAFAQKIEKPTLTPKAPTDSQQALIREGISHHDAKEYDKAIAKYEAVLKENPDSTFAMYELALTQYAKGDREKAIETALRGSRYRSQELALFYGTIANAIDDAGKPKDAIKLYNDALKILKNEPEMKHHIPSVHYNLGVTYTRQKMYAEAKEQLKRSVELNNGYPSPHYLLSEVFMGTKFKVPAMLAAARLISLEPNSQRSERAIAIFNTVMAPAKKNDKTGNTEINLDFFASEEEGNFTIYDIMIPTLTLIDDEKNKDSNTVKTEEDKFADGFDTLITMLSEDKKLRSTFVGKNYVPFLAEMKQLGYSRAFVNIVLYRSGNPNAQKWLQTNGLKLEQFLNWAKDYKPSGK